jgi:hypothetical protein
MQGSFQSRFLQIGIESARFNPIKTGKELSQAFNPNAGHVSIPQLPKSFNPSASVSIPQPLKIGLMILFPLCGQVWMPVLNIGGGISSSARWLFPLQSSPDLRYLVR